MHAVWLVLAAMSLAAMACAAPQPAAPPPEPAQPKPGGVLNVRERIYYGTNLDPTLALRGEGTHTTMRVFNSLLTFKWGPELEYNDQVIVPLLAERWEASPDGKSYTFHLRRGVRFADLAPVNGREMTAADVKWSFEYIGRLGEFAEVKFPGTNQIKAKLEGLDRVEITGPYTAVAHFKEPYAPFLTYAATPQLAVMPREVYQQDGDFNQRPIGTGPWQFDATASQAGTRMVFKKNPTYWEAGKPYLDEVRSVVITESSSAKAAFQTRQVDIFHSVESLADSEELLSKVPDAKFNRYLGWNSLRVYFNVNVPPFTDVRFRRALDMAIDREEFLRAFTKGQGAWAMGATVPGIFTQEEMKQLVPYRPDEARRLLRESGYASSPVEIEYMYSTGYGEQLLSDSQLLQAQLKKVGIVLTIVSLDRNELSARRRSGKYMMTATGTGSALEPDPDVYVHSYFHPKSGTNYYHVNDPKLTEFTEAQRRETDPAKRKEVWRQQAKYVVDNGYAPWIYHMPIFDFWQPYVKNFHPNIGNEYRPLPDTWLEK